MQLALDQFRVSIARVRDLIDVHNYIKSQSTPALDLSDILRASLVLAVSALDYYIHEVVTLGMLEIYKGERPQTAAFSRFQVSLGNTTNDRLMLMNIESWLETEIQLSQAGSFLPESPSVSDLLPLISSAIQNKLNQTSLLNDELRENLGYKSFQKPDKIADAIRLIYEQKLWDEVAQQMGKSAQDIKQQLSAIVDRRNKIAHQADIDPSFGIGNRWPIDDRLVSDCVDFLEQLVETIHQVLT
ncbi:MULTISPECIES: HEPN domain-containing protein [Limnospira]|uniref:RiboL-PSP-HEPN domain-containing protein n=4 Tax=Sirenicapillariaceae TaxID=2934961 RepID=A0A9P1KJ62_9CYAN|nr:MULTISPECIES: HEPN domain-containing protein [Limnospira]EKD08221.1 hypothetical protein SPLC1_S271430 [Arthrospira platensis C1]MDC0836939.1 HEPN domain-containing protein [Limnoraphis robusta]QJB25268.1 hypothetical protein HFV01_04955 [Limnospira fusiformis SAG 85.79]EDZ92124.1 conserved hypothetical protein [Limnospira maxima CS-328]QNH56612.1 MAG: hypothetical protein H2674_20620 [Limnospira indica BM01]